MTVCILCGKKTKVNSIVSIAPEVYPNIAAIKGKICKECRKRPINDIYDTAIIIHVNTRKSDFKRNRDKEVEE